MRKFYLCNQEDKLPSEQGTVNEVQEIIILDIQELQRRNLFCILNPLFIAAFLIFCYTIYLIDFNFNYFNKYIFIICNITYYFKHILSFELQKKCALN